MRISKWLTKAGFILTPPDHQIARPKYSYFPLSDNNTSELKNSEAECNRVKADFLRIARNNRRKSELSRSNRLEARVQFTVGHPDVLAIFQKLR